MHASFSRLRVVSLLVLGLACTSAQAIPAFSNLIVFGDSLADNGNIRLAFDASPLPIPNTPLPIPSNAFIPQAPYDRGPGLVPALSNGAVWSERLAQLLGVGPSLPSLAGGDNWSFGGALMGPNPFPFPPSLPQQVSTFIDSVNAASPSPAGPDAPADALYVLMAGGNDARLAAQVTDPADVAGLIGRYGDALATSVSDLVAEGARSIVITNVPDISVTPAIGSLGPSAAAAAGALVEAFNTAYDTTLALLDAQFGALMLDDVNLIRFDFAGLLRRAVTDPVALGFSNSTDACAASPACIADPSQHLFWDGIHPTAAGHARIADGLAAALVPAPATLLLILPFVALSLRIRSGARR